MHLLLIILIIKNIFISSNSVSSSSSSFHEIDSFSKIAFIGDNILVQGYHTHSGFISLISNDLLKEFPGIKIEIFLNFDNNIDIHNNEIRDTITAFRNNRKLIRSLKEFEPTHLISLFGTGDLMNLLNFLKNENLKYDLKEKIGNFEESIEIKKFMNSFEVQYYRLLNDIHYGYDDYTSIFKKPIEYILCSPMMIGTDIDGRGTVEQHLLELISGIIKRIAISNIFQNKSFEKSEFEKDSLKNHISLSKNFFDLHLIIYKALEKGCVLSDNHIELNFNGNTMIAHEFLLVLINKKYSMNYQLPALVLHNVSYSDCSSNSITINVHIKKDGEKELKKNGEKEVKKGEDDKEYVELKIKEKEREVQQFVFTNQELYELFEEENDEL